MDHGSRHTPIAISLNDLLSAVAEQMALPVHSRRLTLRLSASEPVTVRGDMDELVRLFLNLTDNAVQYTPETGSVEVAVDREDGAARVRIANTGDGIPPEDLPFVFDRFYRVAADRSRRTGGAGLGLAIAQEIARKHGGRITAESEPGVLTTFTVLLPANGPPPRGGGE